MSILPLRVYSSPSCLLFHFVSTLQLRVPSSTSCPLFHFVSTLPLRVHSSTSCPLFYTSNILTQSYFVAPALYVGVYPSRPAITPSDVTEICTGSNNPQSGHTLDTHTPTNVPSSLHARAGTRSHATAVKFMPTILTKVTYKFFRLLKQSNGRLTTTQRKL